MLRATVAGLQRDGLLLLARKGLYDNMLQGADGPDVRHSGMLGGGPGAGVATASFAGQEATEQSAELERELLQRELGYVLREARRKGLRPSQVASAKPLRPSPDKACQALLLRRAILLSFPGLARARLRLAALGVEHAMRV